MQGTQHDFSVHEHLFGSSGLSVISRMSPSSNYTNVSIFVLGPDGFSIILLFLSPLPLSHPRPPNCRPFGPWKGDIKRLSVFCRPRINDVAQNKPLSLCYGTGTWKGLDLLGLLANEIWQISAWRRITKLLIQVLSRLNFDHNDFALSLTRRRSPRDTREEVTSVGR